MNLDTHIDDVVNLILWEELSDVVLCGPSYRGGVIGGVADHVPDRIGALVYLDAFVLENGQSVPRHSAARTKRTAAELTLQHGDGWKVPPIPAEVFNVNANDLEWVNRECTMQPLATFQAITLRGSVGAVKYPTYILATGWNDSRFPRFTSKRRPKAGTRSRSSADTT